MDNLKRELELQWDTTEGFHCMVRINRDSGLPKLNIEDREWRCGYVGVPCEHPMYEVKYNGCILGCKSVTKELQRLDNMPADMKMPMHTSWPCVDGEWGYKHPSPGQVIEVHGGLTFSGRDLTDMKPELWYFGFDCAHAGDDLSLGGSVKDRDYVINEIESHLLPGLKNYTLVRSIEDMLGE